VFGLIAQHGEPLPPPHDSYLKYQKRQFAERLTSQISGCSLLVGSDQFCLWAEASLTSIVSGQRCLWPVLSLGRGVSDQICFWAEVSLTSFVSGQRCLWPVLSQGRGISDRFCRWAELSLSWFVVFLILVVIFRVVVQSKTIRIACHRNSCLWIVKRS